MNNENRIAVVCIYGIGENGLNIVRSLGKAKIPVIVLGIKDDLCLAKYSKFCSRYEQIEAFDKNLLLGKLFQIRNEIEYNPILFFDNDYMLALLNDSEYLLSEKFILTQRIKNFTFKEFQMMMATKAGIDVPKTWIFNTWQELETFKFNTDFKLIAKPSQDSSKKPFKTIIAKNKKELISFLQKKVDSPQKVIIQEYIEGEQINIWTVLGYKSKHGFSKLLTAVKYSMYPPDGGVMAIGRVVKNEKLIEISKNFISKVNYSGVFGLEFKYSSKYDKYYFIELSPRTEGFHNITKLIDLDLPIVAYNDLVLEKGIQLQKERSYAGYWINFRYFVESLVAQKSLRDIYKFFSLIFSKKEYQHLNLSDMKPFIYANKWYLKIWKKRLKKLFDKNGK